MFKTLIRSIIKFFKRDSIPTTLYRSLPDSGLNIPMPECKPPMDPNIFPDQQENFRK